MGLRGLEAFNLFYEEMYKERWETLKASLLAPKKHIAVLNPYSGFEFPTEGSILNGLNFKHQVQDLFPHPEKTTLGYMNYYLIDAPSILAVEALDPRPGERVVDLCAAPGGKSFLCALKMNNQGLLISNDRSASKRARIHRTFDDYIPKTQQTKHKVTSFEPSKWCLYEKNLYDKVLLDAPCSIERHTLDDEKELSLWTSGRTKAMAVSQIAMLTSALDIVKVGGTVVYTSGALSKFENDGLIDNLHRKRGGRFEILTKTFPIGEKTEYGWQVLPDKDGWGPCYLTIIKKLK